MLAPNMKAEPPKATQSGGSKVVRVMKVVPREIQPSAEGYGHTEPVYHWEAQSELEGTVTWIADDFKTGAILKKDTEILRLDPSSYQLNIARLEAELDVSKLTDKTIQESLAIAERDYKVQKSEYDRTLRLSKSGHLSQNEKDKATRELLSSQQQLQTLKNNLAINKAQQQVLNTELALANRDLENTVIRAPGDIRVTDKLVSLAEYVSKGEVMLQADVIDAVEISAQFPLGKMEPLRKNTSSKPLDNNHHSDLEAIVELKANNRLITWEATVSRTGGRIDAQTQSQSIVVEVADPYTQFEPGKKPPLIRDTFVKVILKAPVLKKKLLLPVTAIHNGKVYTVKEGKLVIKPVKIDFVQGQIAVIKSGIETDDVVVLSKLMPAVEGMSLKSQPDKKINKWFEKETGFKAGQPKSSEG
jgi:RND family efflux transporter MFP subunit